MCGLMCVDDLYTSLRGIVSPTSVRTLPAFQNPLSIPQKFEFQRFNFYLVNMGEACFIQTRLKNLRNVYGFLFTAKSEIVSKIQMGPNLRGKSKLVHLNFKFLVLPH
jgi:hypothetical protein